MENILHILKTDYRIQYPRFNDEFPIELEENCQKLYQEKKFSQLLMTVNSQARIWLFLEIQDELDDESYFRLLGEVLTFTYISFDSELFLYLLHHPSRPASLRHNVMSNEEQKFHDKLPPEILIFRGAKVGNRDGFSWTLNKETAMKFAKRHSPLPGELLTGKCHKNKLIAYFSREEEVLIRPNHVIIEHALLIDPEEQKNNLRINHHTETWKHIKSSETYKKFKKNIHQIKQASFL
ncbi:hypothetical protein N9Y92_00495 [Chlamydiales bacterium]|nr:hypothetical protein [Chlamydiales bacterium]